VRERKPATFFCFLTQRFSYDSMLSGEETTLNIIFCYKNG